MRSTLATLLTCVVCASLACTAKSARGPEDDPALPGGGGPDDPAEDLSVAAPPPDAFQPTSYDFSRPPGKDRACASVRAEAMLVKKPVDVVIVVDNSPSMTDEIVAVERNINKNFAEVLDKSGIDYRTILVAKHGVSLLDQSVCIVAPLSGNMSCTPPPLCPVNGPRFFHYSMRINSTDSLANLLSSFGARDFCGLAPMGWGKWLRTDAVRAILEISDDNSELSADDFESQLFAKTPLFGTALNRNYVFHTIAGLKENSPATKAWGPMDPIQTANCTRGGGAVNPGQVYQELSVRTGGLRFPICEHASFDAVFKAVAAGVAAGTQVKCEFPVPAPPAGEMIDLDTVRVEYQPGAGAVQTFNKVASAGACAPGSFYISGGKILLCPDACRAVQADAMAKLQVLFDCAITVN